MGLHPARIQNIVRKRCSCLSFLLALTRTHTQTHLFFWLNPLERKVDRQQEEYKQLVFSFWSLVERS